MITFSEAIKLKDGRLYDLEYHQRRVDRTVADFFGGRIDLGPLSGMIPPDAACGLFKCRVLYAGAILSVEFIPYVFRTIHRVRLVEADGLDYGYKYADRSAIAQLVTRSGCDDIIMIRNGLVSDASSSSLVFASSEGLFTPREYLLPGTKRQVLIDSGTVSERSIRIEDIWDFDSVYFVNAMTDLQDGIKIEIPSQIETL